MSDNTNSALQDALTVSRNNVPANPTPGRSDGPVLPSGGNQKAVQGLPDIKDKTTQGNQPPAQQQQQPVQEQEQTSVPVSALKEERQKRQELERMVQAGNSQNQQLTSKLGQLEQHIATLTGQLNTLGNQQHQALQNQQAAQQQPAIVPDPLADPDGWSEWLLGTVRQEVFGMVKNLGMDIFNQRLRHFNDMHQATHGPQKVAEATNWINQVGRLEEAMSHYDATGFAIREYNRAKGLERLPMNPESGEFDWNGYNQRVVSQFLQSPQYQQFLNQQAGQQQPQQPQQPVQQQPMQYQQPAQPQYPNIPQSMAQQSGGGNTNVVPMPSANQSLQASLREAVGPRR